MNKLIRINGKLYEAVEPRRNRRRSLPMNESYGKPVDRSASNKYDLMGIELPDGSPDLYFVHNDGDSQVVVYIYGVDDESGQLVVTVKEDGNEEAMWGFDFDADEQDSAMSRFENICKLVDKGKIFSVVNKFGLKRVPLI